MKSYKHKKLGWIAEEWESSYYFSTQRDNQLGTNTYVPKELIENSNDWELIEEKDWIYNAFWYIKSDTIENFRSTIENFRSTIEKHMPKVTEEELEKNLFDSKYIDINKIISLLKSKGLLAE